MWIAGLPPFFGRTVADVLLSMAITLRRSGQRGDPGNEATLELLGIEDSQDVAEMVGAGVPSLNGRARRKSSRSLQPNRAISTTVSAPASTASRHGRRISSSG